MARKKKTDLVNIPAVEPQAPAAAPLPVSHASRKRLHHQHLEVPEGSESVEHTISLPLLTTAPEGMYCPRHFEMRLDNVQAANLKRLAFGLQMAGVEIRGAMDALKWLVDQLPPVVDG